QNEVTLLRSEVAQLKQLLLAHKDCPVTLLQKKSGYHQLDKEDSGGEMSVPSSPQNEAIQHSSISTSNGVSSSTACSQQRSHPAPRSTRRRPQHRRGRRLAHGRRFFLSHPVFRKLIRPLIGHFDSWQTC
ncbi:hypothetical protein cypCar_00040434, partial [Cyprinus carpio]